MGNNKMDMEQPGNPEDPSDQHKIKSQGLAFVFNAARDAFPKNPVPYYDDGDPDMYTTENIAKRKTLKTNEVVCDAIKDFITSECDCERNGSISKDNYSKMFMRIGMILRPGFEADELQRIVREDFETDC